MSRINASAGSRCKLQSSVWNHVYSMADVPGAVLRPDRRPEADPDGGMGA